MNLPAVHIAAITLVCYLVTRVDSRPSEHLILRNGTVSPPEVYHAPCTTKFRNLTGLISEKNGIKYTQYRWKTFKVYVDPSYSASHRQLMARAMNRLKEAVPCLKFHMVPKGTKPSGDYVHIKKGNGCWSYVGRLGGKQDMSLQENGCMFLGTIMHEMIHALGFNHEHARADRDDHITVRMRNVQAGTEDQFTKVNTRDWTTFGVKYNTKSIMHYDSYAFSKNGKQTMVTKAGRNIGRNEALAATDKTKLKKMYKCT